MDHKGWTNLLHSNMELAGEGLAAGSISLEHVRGDSPFHPYSTGLTMLCNTKVVVSVQLFSMSNGGTIEIKGDENLVIAILEKLQK